MKTKEELNEIKEEVEKLDKKLYELTEEELEQVSGGKEHSISHGSALTKIEEIDSPACHAPQENLNVAKPEGCAACEYYESCHNPDKA